MVGILSGFEQDSHRQPLDHFHIVAGCVFGWKQAEHRARGSADCIDVSFIVTPIRIDIDLYRLARTHVLELRLFEVGDHPHIIEWNDGEQFLSRLNILADLDRFAADDSIHRRFDHCIVQVQLRLFDYGLLFCDRRGR